jgi:[glutamine synthetase] adenylyltransferase / [glutamine synthetase]-adenylyl-L-tyrosine phosphorylase
MSKIGIHGLDDPLSGPSGLVEHLQQSGGLEAALQALGANDPQSTALRLRNVAESGLPDDLLSALLTQIEAFFGSSKGIDLAIDQLAQFFERARSPLALATLFERDADALPMLLRIFAIDGPLAKILLDDVESFDLLRAAQGRSVSMEALLADLRSEVEATEGERNAALAMRRFHSREILRIGYGLLVGESDGQRVSEQLSLLAEAFCRVATEICARRLVRSTDSEHVLDRFAVIEHGACASGLMQFESPLQLAFLFEEGALTGDVPVIAEEAERVASAVIAMLGASESKPYHVERFAYEGVESARLAASGEQSFRSLDQFGRTWQRLELLSARTVAGSTARGDGWLARLEPWIYRRRLSDADIDGLRFQYRKWRSAIAQGDFGGLIRGIRILQLTLAGDHPRVRQRNPLEAIAPLSSAGAIAARDAEPLKKSLSELNRRMLFVQLGAVSQANGEWAVYFLRARTIISDALARVFGDAPSPPLAADIVMDPMPAHDQVNAALAPFGFEIPIEAGGSLRRLAEESSPLLSTRKSRHYLSMIAPALLSTISQTPSPDQTLSVLSRVVDSLGAKGALWELFLANPPSMELCIRICAYSPYLSNILIASPGFIDELLDSLQLARLPSLAAMESRLDDLCRGAELDQAIQEFKSALHLRIGVRDVLGKEEITTTHRALAQTAEAIVRRVAAEQYKELAHKHGAPVIEGPELRDCRHVLLVSGKLGALEPNYQSEVEFAVIYEGDGMTRPASRGMAAVSCAHFFGQLAQRSLRKLTTRGRLGQLFSVNNDLRPLGAQGPMAVSLDALRHHYLDAPQPWRELLWLCKARPAGGDAGLAADLSSLLHEAISKASLTRADVAAFRKYRVAQTTGANPLNLKRALGGTQHIELLVQFLQLAYAKRFPRVLSPGTLDAIAHLASEHLLTLDEGRVLADRYRFLRTLESRLRLLNTLARHDLPANESELRTLAMFVDAESGEALRDECIAALREVDELIHAREERLANELPY